MIDDELDVVDDIIENWVKADVQMIIPVLKVFCSNEKERIYRREYKSIDDVKKDVFDYIELFYNRKRLHSVLGYMSPVECRYKYDVENIVWIINVYTYIKYNMCEQISSHSKVFNVGNAYVWNGVSAI